MKRLFAFAFVFVAVVAILTNTTNAESSTKPAELSPPAAIWEAPPTVSEANSWSLILINRDHPLPADYEIPELTPLINGHAIDSRVYPDLQRMMDDCRAAGLQPLICSSYRTWEDQEALFENDVQAYMEDGFSRAEAEEKTALWVARPGTSEHEAGLAVDIVDESYQHLDEDQEQTPVQQWLLAHCQDYGFILRYPTEKSDMTGVGYEPWHYRYVGREAASEIMENGICLEQYFD